LKNSWSGVSLTLGIILILVFSGCGGSDKKTVSNDVVTNKPVINASSEEIAAAVLEASNIMTSLNRGDADYKKVVSLLEGYESLPSSPVTLYEYLGEAHLYLAHFEKAEQALAAGLQRDLYSARIRDLLSNLNYVRGRLVLEEKQASGAKKFFANALFYAPEDSMLSHNISNSYTARAVAAFNDSEWELCSRLFTEARNLKIPVSSDTYKYISKALLEQNEPLEALNAANKYLSEHSDDVPVLMVKGVALQQLDRIAEAHSVFRKIEALEPGNVDVTRAIRNLSAREEHVHWFNALRQIEDGNLQQAQLELELAIKEVSPGDILRQKEIFARLASVSIELNDYQRALMYVDNALAIAPEDINLNLEKGGILRLSQRLAEAKKVFEVLLIKFPDNADIKLATADFYLQLKLPGNAIPHLENLINEAKDDLPKQTLLKALTILGGCYALQKQYVKAEKAWHVLSEMEPGNARVLFNLGLLYQNHHQYGMAIDYYERACRSVSLYEPNLARYLYGLAFAFRQNGQGELYTRVLVDIVEICPVDNGYRRRAYKSLVATGWAPSWKTGASENIAGTELFIRKGNEFLEEGEIEKAQDMFLQVISTDPPSSNVLRAAAFSGLGLVNLTKGNYARAAAQYMESLHLVPSDGKSLLRLGQVFEQLALWADAEENYKKAAGLLEGSYKQQALLQLSVALYKQNKNDESIKVLDRMVNSDSESILSGFAVKRIAERQEELLKVIPVVDEVERRKIARAEARAFGSVAEALAENGNGRKAREYIERARSLIGNDVEIMLVEAHLLSVEGDSDKALALLDEASATSPYDTRILMLKSKIYFGQNQMLKAIGLLESIVKADGSHFEAVAALADVYQAEGRIAEAKGVLEALLSLSVQQSDKIKASEKLKMLGASG
jgi:tetratricopeptide (TPR) repeat protein